MWSIGVAGVMSRKFSFPCISVKNWFQNLGLGRHGSTCFFVVLQFFKAKASTLEVLPCHRGGCLILGIVFWNLWCQRILCCWAIFVSRNFEKLFKIVCCEVFTWCEALSCIGAIQQPDEWSMWGCRGHVLEVHCFSDFGEGMISDRRPGSTLLHVVCVD